MSAVGHLNPMLALVGALSAHSARPHVRAFGTRFVAPLFDAAGAAFEEHTDPHTLPSRLKPASSDLSALTVRSFLAPQCGLADLVRRIDEFRPHVVVHDVFDLRGKVAAHALARVSDDLAVSRVGRPVA